MIKTKFQKWKRYIDEKRKETWICKALKYEEKKWDYNSGSCRIFLAIERGRF